MHWSTLDNSGWYCNVHGTIEPPCFKGIKKLHHMRFTRSKPGVCFVQTSSDSEVKEIKFLREGESWKPSGSELPPVIPPEGLLLERKHYLFEKKSCPRECQDLVCPDPATLHPTSSVTPPPPHPVVPQSGPQFQPHHLPKFTLTHLHLKKPRKKIPSHLGNLSSII